MRLIIKGNNGEQSEQPQQTEPDVIGADNLQVKQEIHLLPCKVRPRKSTSPVSQTLTAPVDRYFCPHLKDAANDDDVNEKNDSGIGSKLWHASMRGKPLTGVQLGMPDGYVGLFCHRGGGETDKDENSDLIADHSNGHVTQQLMYWNWDRVPTREDPLLAALDWVNISEAIMSNRD